MNISFPSPMDKAIAKKIAALLNRRNQLPNKLSEYDIINNNYFFIEGKMVGEKRQLIACARAKCMSFYAYEIKHVAVNEEYEGNGFGRMMIEMVEEYIRTKRIPLAMATTRANNDPIIHLFDKLGYSPTKQFVNHGTSHPLIVWQKHLL